MSQGKILLSKTSQYMFTLLSLIFFSNFVTFRDIYLLGMKFKKIKDGTCIKRGGGAETCLTQPTQGSHFPGLSLHGIN